MTAPDGRVMKLPAEEFLAMQDTVIIKKDIVYERVETVDTKGNKVWKAGKPTGWKVEQGGYPPLGVRVLERVFLHQGQLRPPLVHRQNRPLQRQCSQGPR